jgi:hypothetical protein
MIYEALIQLATVFATLGGVWLSWKVAVSLVVNFDKRHPAPTPGILFVKYAGVFLGALLGLIGGSFAGVAVMCSIPIVLCAMLVGYPTIQSINEVQL